MTNDEALIFVEPFNRNMFDSTIYGKIIMVNSR